MATHYEVLGLHPSAVQVEIERRHRELVSQLHPDRNAHSPQAAAHFKVVQSAFEVLHDPVQRAEYDRQIGFPAGQWAEIRMGAKEGSAQFNADGSLVIGSKSVGLWDTLTGDKFGKTQIWKKSGPGDLLMVSPTSFRCYKYLDGLWLMWMASDDGDVISAGKQFLRWHEGAKHLAGSWPQAGPASPPPMTDGGAMPAGGGGGNFAPPSSAAPAFPWFSLPSWLRTRHAAYALAAVLFIGAVWIVLHRPASKAEQLAAEQAELQQQAQLMKDRRRLLEEQKGLDDLELQSGTRRQVSTTIRARLLAAQQTARNVLAEISQLETEIEQWNQKVRPLLSNEEGRFLAARPDDLRAFRALFHKDVPASADAAAHREQVQALLAPLEEELAKELPLVGPDERVLQELDSRSAKVKQQIKQYRDLRRQIESLLAAARRSGEPASLTLEQALGELDLAESREAAAKIAAEEEQARQKALGKLAADSGKQAGDQMEQERLLKEAQALREKHAAELTLNKEKAQDSEVQALLRPFTTPGYVQADNSLTAEKRPHSLSKLQAAGALESSENGLDMLRRIASNEADTERPRWDMSRVSLINLSPGQAEKLRKTQQRLIELGDALVELKLLDP